MLAFIFGIFLILAGGLANHENLVDRQPSLKTILHHLTIYRSSIGLVNSVFGITCFIHALFTSVTHTYAPLFWLAYTLSAYFAFMIGIMLSFEYLQPFLMKVPSGIHRVFVHVQLWSTERKDSISWYAMGLGVWKVFESLVGVE